MILGRRKSEIFNYFRKQAEIDQNEKKRAHTHMNEWIGFKPKN